MHDILNEYGRIDGNKLAEAVAEAEGGAVRLSIAQVKESISITCAILATLPAGAVMDLLALSRARRDNEGKPY